jgi:hypothetical protein
MNRIELINEKGKHYWFVCPGCGHRHVVQTEPTEYRQSAWGFNGNLERPTFTPSLLVTSGHYVQGQPQPPDCIYCNEDTGSCYRCHSFITDGKIQFLGDCTHAFAGQTVDLKEIEPKQSAQ